MGEREIKAFALAPLPVVALLLLSIGVNAALGGGGDGSAAGAFLAMSFFAVLIYGTALVIGIPIHLLLRHFQKTSLIYYIISAAFPFVLFAAAIVVWRCFAPPPAPPVNPFGLYMEGGVVVKWTLVLAAIASFSASIFWYAGVRSPKL